MNYYLALQLSERSKHECRENHFDDNLENSKILLQFSSSTPSIIAWKMTKYFAELLLLLLLYSPNNNENYVIRVNCNTKKKNPKNW